MRKDRIGMRIQKKERIKSLMYSKARSRAAFEELVIGLGVVTTRDKPIGSAEVGLDVMVGRGSKEGRVEEGVEP
jgi:hypothetical protein